MRPGHLPDVRNVERPRVALAPSSTLSPRALVRDRGTFLRRIGRRRQLKRRPHLKVRPCRPLSLSRPHKVRGAQRTVHGVSEVETCANLARRQRPIKHCVPPGGPRSARSLAQARARILSPATYFTRQTKRRIHSGAHPTNAPPANGKTGVSTMHSGDFAAEADARLEKKRGQ